jgi:hypothetical protein
LGYTYYDYPNANDNSDVGEVWFSLTFKELPLDLSFNTLFAYDFKITSLGPDEGWYYSFGLSKNFPLPKSFLFQEGQTLNLGINCWGNDGVAGLKPTFVYATEFSLSTTYNLNKIGISPSINYVLNYEEEINQGEDEFWVGIEFGCSF